MTSPGASFGTSARTALSALSVCLEPVAQRQGPFPRSHEDETRHARATMARRCCEPLTMEARAPKLMTPDQANGGTSLLGAAQVRATR